MTVFIDSSALVKLYVPEFQHDFVRAIDEPIYISTIAQVEVPAAMWRKHRLGEIQAADAALLCADFAADIEGDDADGPRFSVISLVDEIIGTAARLVAIHAIRAYDAVQLATAIVVRTIAVDAIGFVTFDRNLHTAAASEGFTSLPHEIS
ncbi:MAG: type II toxin-antitoxin system VapC family toxin [Ilumatobacteraceae bacterium]